MKKREFYTQCIIGARYSGKTHFLKVVFMKRTPSLAKKYFKKYIKEEIDKQSFLNIMSQLCESVIEAKGEQE